MSLPLSLQQAIDILLSSNRLSQLNQARQELTTRYREKQSHAQFMVTDEQRYSYIATRFPATYAAIKAILKAIEERAPHLTLETALDLGSGPGTALWALNQQFPAMQSYTLIEQDETLINLGQKLIKLSQVNFPVIHWQQAKIEQMDSFFPHDLVICSYAIGELNQQMILPLVDKAWQATQQLLVIVEPGTPVGFERIRAIRAHLIQSGAYLVAPCPHQLACPMTGGDWCHFAARVQRSSTHRQLKGGSLGYEDEKFSYVVASKSPYSLPESRVLRHPIHHSGHVQLKLCTSEGVKEPIISRKMGKLYKQMKHIEWGSPFPPS